MAQTYAKSFNNCSVCNYWGGSRQADTYGTRVAVSSSSVKGKCLNQKGPWRGQEKNAGTTCPKWEAWSALK